ncbi:MAG TPA: CehA/McbA family metallohydrolase [Verrucomicrobiae bacterium]|nr:CehA/McbA family metallohydrolase [Verrucomicrobiae bacterium]
MSTQNPRSNGLLSGIISRWAIVGLVAWVPLSLFAQAEGRSLDEAMHHLGDSEITDWPGIAPQPEGTRLKLEFESSASGGPVTLKLRHRDVDGRWEVRLNERTVAELRRGREEKDHYYEVPAGTLRAGVNVLEVVPDNPTDDIAIGRVVLHAAPRRTVLNLRTLTVRVTDADSQAALPARVIIETIDGTLPQLYADNAERVAVREGLLYVHGAARLELPAGRYRIAATRGMEWSRDEQPLDLSADATVALALRREVDTPGFIAADTHLHTYTLSGHGDATIEERVLSLAGEGVELAVASDHNHHTDYRPYQEKLALNEFFTPVTGNEVTTSLGHFNAFPLPPAGEVPDHKQADWLKLVDDIRMKGAKVVILNHPRWPNLKQSPLEVLGLNRATGDRGSGMAFPFDAMELVNSTVDTPDPLYLFTDWFGLLNAGEKISAVGSSDSHTVGDPVGQGRTYLPSSTDVPAELNVDELCDHLLKGRASISLGIFATVRVDERYTSGDLVPIDDGKVNVRLRVASAGWIRPRRALVFLNGMPVAEQDVPTEDGRPTNATLTFTLPVRGVDGHLVCVVLGDPVKHAGWKTLNDYTLAATNPVFLDVNRDGSYTSPRDSARRILASVGGDVDALINTLEVVPPPVGVQMLALGHARVSGVDLVRLNEGVQRLAEFHAPFALYWKHYEAERAAAARTESSPAR